MRDERGERWHVERERERETCHETREKATDERERARERGARECEGLVRVLI